MRKLTKWCRRFQHDQEVHGNPYYIFNITWLATPFVAIIALQYVVPVAALGIVITCWLVIISLFLGTPKLDD